MIAYRTNPRYLGRKEVRQAPRIVHNRKTSVDELGPYRDRANAHHGKSAFALRVGRPRSDFEVVSCPEGFRVRLRLPLAAVGSS